MDIRECDVVRLIDGRKGAVLGIYSGGSAFEIELDPPETETVKPEQIQEVIYRP